MYICVAVDLASTIEKLTTEKCVYPLLQTCKHLIFPDLYLQTVWPKLLEWLVPKHIYHVGAHLLPKQRRGKAKISCNTESSFCFIDPQQRYSQRTDKEDFLTQVTACRVSAAPPGAPFSLWRRGAEGAKSLGTSLRNFFNANQPPPAPLWTGIILWTGHVSLLALMLDCIVCIGCYFAHAAPRHQVRARGDRGIFVDASSLSPGGPGHTLCWRRELRLRCVEQLSNRWSFGLNRWMGLNLLSVKFLRTLRTICAFLTALTIMN